MSRWSHVEGRIKCFNLKGLEKILTNQEYKTEPWKHYLNPYPSLNGSEGSVSFEKDGEDGLYITGNLRDVDGLLVDKEQIIRDFKDIIGIVRGKGYIEIEYEFEGTIVVDFYEKFSYRIFPQADGWDRYYDNIIKKLDEIK